VCDFTRNKWNVCMYECTYIPEVIRVYTN
jgi:hypothetical protein